jgi:3-dehydroquinate dehydratase-2
MIKFLVIHGPNLNLLGEREPEVYGSMTLPELNSKIRAFAKKQGAQLRLFQSNSEGGLIDFIHKNRKWAQGIVINPGAYTHYSYALRDALASVSLPVVEVHLSDIHSREEFRKISVISPICIKQISGLGWKSYIEGLSLLLERTRGRK